VAQSLGNTNQVQPVRTCNPQRFTSLVWLLPEWQATPAPWWFIAHWWQCHPWSTSDSLLTISGVTAFAQWHRPDAHFSFLGWLLIAIQWSELKLQISCHICIHKFFPDPSWLNKGPVCFYWGCLCGAGCMPLDAPTCGISPVWIHSHSPCQPRQLMISGLDFYWWFFFKSNSHL
jgi:hypothetical protein